MTDMALRWYTRNDEDLLGDMTEDTMQSRSEILTVSIQDTIQPRTDVLTVSQPDTIQPRTDVLTVSKTDTIQPRTEVPSVSKPDTLQPKTEIPAGPESEIMLSWTEASTETVQGTNQHKGGCSTTQATDAGPPSKTQVQVSNWQTKDTAAPLPLGTTTAEDPKKSNTVSEQDPGLPMVRVITVSEQDTKQSTMTGANTVSKQDPGLPMVRVNTVSEQDPGLPMVRVITVSEQDPKQSTMTILYIK